MTRVIFGLMLSLDGCINDEHGSVAPLYPDPVALMASAQMQETIRTTGAVVMGRRTYEMAEGDYTGYEFQTPIFVVTRRPPATVARGENARLRFHFVTDGVVSAVAQVRSAAGGRDVVIVGGAQTFQQALNAGVVDELQLAIRPILLGAGLRLFDGIDAASVTLEPLATIAIPGATELRYRVVR